MNLSWSETSALYEERVKFSLRNNASSYRFPRVTAARWAGPAIAWPSLIAEMPSARVVTRNSSIEEGATVITTFQSPQQKRRFRGSKSFAVAVLETISGIRSSSKSSSNPQPDLDLDELRIPAIVDRKSTR